MRKNLYLCSENEARMKQKLPSIGILTYHRALNYGAVWQGWALKKSCELLGYPTRVIDYSPYGVWQYKYFFHKRPDKAFTKITQLYWFERFIQKYLNLSEYTDSNEYMRTRFHCDDITIVGSDQIWNVKSVQEHIGAYMLDFVPANKQRIAYACSMGGVFATSEYLDVFKSELPKFLAISLREPDFLEEMSAISGKMVVDVCDPSLLPDKSYYETMEKKKWGLPKHYIAVMDLSGDPFLKEVVKKAKSILHIPVVNIMGGYTRWADKNIYSLQPEQWLYVIHHADLMITNSFHGTAFSIKYQTPFLSCPKKIEHLKAGNLRLTNILTQCGLMSQCITNVNQVPEALMVDWDQATTKIEYYRQHSLEWLKNAINHASNQK